MRSTYVPTSRYDQVFLEYPDKTWVRIYPTPETTSSSGISWETIVKLYDHGFRSPEEAASASDEDLLAVRGIGKKTLEEIRSAL